MLFLYIAYSVDRALSIEILVVAGHKDGEHQLK